MPTRGWQRFAGPLLAMAALIMAACASTGVSRSPVVTATFGPPQIRGVAYHGTWTSRDDHDRTEILDAVAAAGIPWVRMDVGWDTLQPDGPGQFDKAAVERLDRQLQEVSVRGLKVMVMLWWAPKWSSGTSDKNGVPADPDDYADVAAWMVQRWSSQIQALQVWNEPDLPEFFATKDASDYARLLKAAYPRVKTVRPDLTVVTAGPANLDMDWYRQFFDEDVSGAFDAVGAHPYPVVGDMTPEQCRQRADSGCDMDHLVSFLASREQGDSPIWVTEFGWSSHPDVPGLPAWRRGVTEEEQARYTAEMMGYFSTIAQVQAAFVYRDRDFTDADIHQNGFGILRANNSPKPVYDVVTCSPVARCDELAAGFE